MPAVVDVVAAVIGGPDGTYLLAQRPPGKVYAGYWEFPGGKVEPGETALAAIRREIREELGIEVIEAHPWLTRHHAYEHASVRLRLFRVVRWRGEPRGLDGQKFEFQTPGAESVGPMLPANGPILKSLGLPQVCGITNCGSGDPGEFFDRLDAALTRGLRLVQIREKGMEAERHDWFARHVLESCRMHGALAIVNGDAKIAERIRADGVHLTSVQLASASSRPDLPWVGASVHSRDELQRAAELGCDYAFLGPVHPTPTHPGAPVLGWQGFRAMAADAELPVFALGGLDIRDSITARENGAHGIAMLRGAWV